MLFSLLEHDLNLYITDTTLKVFPILCTVSLLLIISWCWKLFPQAVVYRHLWCYYWKILVVLRRTFLSAVVFITTFYSSGPEKDRFMASAVILLLPLLLGLRLLRGLGLGWLLQILLLHGGCWRWGKLLMLVVEVYPSVGSLWLCTPKNARESWDVVCTFFACDGGYWRWI